MKLRIWRPVCSLAFLGLAAPLQAQDATAERVELLIGAFDAEMAAYREKLQAAPADQRRALYDQRPSPKETGEALHAIITASPAHASVPAAAEWLLMNRRVSAENNVALYKALEDHHLKSEGMAKTCIAVIYDSSDEAKAFTKSVFDGAENPQVKAAAAYTIAQSMRGGDPAEVSKYLRIAAGGLGNLEFRGRKLKDAAAGKLFAAENLVIGKPAPEIEGVDTAGVAFKLSDYRGKVVVLDFWGDW